MILRALSNLGLWLHLWAERRLDDRGRDIVARVIDAGWVRPLEPGGPAA